MHFNVIIFILFFAVPLLLLQHVPIFLFSIITHQTFDILFYLCVFKRGTVSEHGSEGCLRESLQ